MPPRILLSLAYVIMSIIHRVDFQFLSTVVCMLESFSTLSFAGASSSVEKAFEKKNVLIKKAIEIISIRLTFTHKFQIGMK